MSNRPKRSSLTAGSMVGLGQQQQQQPSSLNNPGGGGVGRREKRLSFSLDVVQASDSRNSSASSGGVGRRSSRQSQGSNDNDSNSSTKKSFFSGRSSSKQQHPILDFSDFEDDIHNKSLFIQGCNRWFHIIRQLLSSCSRYIYNVIIINCLSVFINFTSYNIVPDTTKNIISEHILSNKIYISTLLCMITYLFFGSFLSDLYCPSGLQYVFDTVSVVVFIFLMIDIVLRCLAEEHYFVINFPCLSYISGGILDINNDSRSVSSTGSITGFGGGSGGGSLAGLSGISGHKDGNHYGSGMTSNSPGYKGFFFGISFGSVYFWSDLISSLTILYEISWINPELDDPITKNIIIQNNGGSTSWVLPREQNNIQEFIFIIGQTLRVSRLVGIMIKLKIYNWQTISNNRHNPCSTSFVFKYFNKHLFKREAAAITIQRWWRKRGITFNKYDIASHLRKKDSPHRTRNKEMSQVGSAMREMTAQRVSIGLFVAMICSYLFTFVDTDNTRYRSMVMLHSQTTNMPSNVTHMVLQSAREHTIPTLYKYITADGTIYDFSLDNYGIDSNELRPRDKLSIIISDALASSNGGNVTEGYFSNERSIKISATVFACYSAYIILLWLIGVSAFIGPVMTLVVHPIERMTHLLTMLMVDPLGYQDTLAFKEFEQEGREFPKRSGWSEEELKGMETTFLLSTILRIGSLMKVGFGSAGVEIIRNSLSDAQSGNTFNLDHAGSITSCIFMFCDIRQFTDCTESLQEEVFVFTNKIAAVIHSFVGAYGGSANKNVGDAFLVSWQLNTETINDGVLEGVSPLNELNRSLANKNQADRALLAVIKIQIALFVDNFYLQELSDVATKRLMGKLESRAGPIVQIGFGLHAGKAVQGAIGSHRKIDPSYISEAVELSEFLESSTKRYGVSVLMSGAFYSLLNPTTARRCRKVDSVLISDSSETDDQFAIEVDLYADDKIMDLYTFDIDVKKAWDYRHHQKTLKRTKKDRPKARRSKSGRMTSTSMLEPLKSEVSRRSSMDSNTYLSRNKNSNNNNVTDVNNDNNIGDNNNEATITAGNEKEQNSTVPIIDDVILPTSRFLFSLKNDFTTNEMRCMVEKYSDGLFYQTFQTGLNSFYSRDWDRAKQSFESILDRIDDGPSKYYLKRISATNGVPPRNFKHYNTMD